MSHTPPVPGSGQSPYPLNAARSADRAETRHELAEEAAAKLKAPAPQATDEGVRWPRFAAGVAIGSAAIAAGVYFWNRSDS